MSSGKRTLVHVGSGSVYLLPEPDGTPWINVDIHRDDCRLVKDDPGGADRWGTTSDRYYGRHENAISELKNGRQLTPPSMMVCDVFGDWTALPFPDASVDLIWSVQVWEHLSKRECALAIVEARRVLKPGGILRLSVPNFDATLAEAYEAYAKGNKNLANFLTRHILGSRKENWAYHTGSWTKLKLLDFCAEYGFEGIGDENNIHEYPSIHHSFKRVPTSHHPEFDEHIIPWRAAYQYCGNPLGTALTVPDDWRVLEIGPGLSEWPRANAVCDIVPRDLPNFTIGDLNGTLPYRDGEFDFVLASHVMEHVVNPVHSARELSRVAKAGCIVCPSIAKEGLFCFHESDHRFWVLKSGDRLLFKRVPTEIPSLYHESVSGQVHRYLRYGDPRLGALSYEARKWWKDAEPRCDVVYHWGPDKPLRVEVLE